MTFEDFWAAYPIKKAKKKAKEKWVSRNLDSMAGQIIKHVQMMLKQDKLWKIGIGIPHPTTYINQDRWDDEPEIEVEREQQLRVPRDDTQLTSFAQQNDLPQPSAGQTYYDYRANLQRLVQNRSCH